MENDKIFFQPGDVVTIKLNIPNKPTMLVVKKETSMFKHLNAEEGTLRGIRCRWFTTDGAIQEEIFNTKDLIIVNN